jgi:hypothetical protein
VQGLENFLSSDKGEGAPNQQVANPQQNAEPPIQTKQTPAPNQNPEELNLEQFKNPKDILKSYKEIQGFTTRVSQENKALKEQLAQLQENMDLMKFRQPVIQPQQQSPQQHPHGKGFDEMFIENPQAAVATVAAATTQQQIRAARMAEALEEESIKNPAEYNERYSYANQLAQQYPQLATSSAGIHKLFEMADKYRKQDYQKKGMEFVKSVFGEDVDFEKFKSAIKKDQVTQPNIADNNAYMPDTSNLNRLGPESNSRQTGLDTEIAAHVAKGDVDSVIKGLFKQADLGT